MIQLKVSFSFTRFSIYFVVCLASCRHLSFHLTFTHNSVLSNDEWCGAFGDPLRRREIKRGGERLTNKERERGGEREEEIRRKGGRERDSLWKVKGRGWLIMWRAGECQFIRYSLTTYFVFRIIPNWSFPNYNYFPFDMHCNWTRIRCTCA